MRAAERRRSIRITISSLVNALDQITGLLKLDREEEGGRDVDSFRLDARLIGAAGSDLIGPEGEARSVGLTIEKIVIVLADKILRVVNHVRRRLGHVIHDGYDGGCGRGQGGEGGISQADVESP